MPAHLKLSPARPAQEEPHMPPPAVAVHTPFSFFVQELRALNPEAAGVLEAAVPPEVGVVLSGCSWSLSEVLRKVSAVAEACQRCDAEAYAVAVGQFRAALAEAQQMAEAVCSQAGVLDEQMMGAIQNVALALAAWNDAQAAQQQAT
jgi:hypothetical protein